MILRLNARRVIPGFIISSLVFWFLLPYDNPLVLLFRWHAHNAKYYANSALQGYQHTLVSSSPEEFPVTLQDVGFIIKTGYATRERLRAQLLTLGSDFNTENVVLAADYETLDETAIELHGKKLPVYDVLASLLQDGFDESPRLAQYSEFHNSLSGNSTVTPNLKGWELDIIKHVPALERGYQQLPLKKWYLLIDDDTYINPPSLLLLLSTLSSSKPHYLGNAIGSYKTRFAHGGSAVIFSSAAFYEMFVSHSNIVKNAHKESLTAEFGDKLVAEMAMAAGIYIEEGMGGYFNGERPRLTRVSSEAVCKAIVSFHGLGPSEFADTKNVIGDIARPFSWGEIWELFGAPDLDDESARRREGWDYVGRMDDAVEDLEDVDDSSACEEMCMRRAKECLAWTWMEHGSRCLLASWFMVGEAAKGKVTGVNVERVAGLMAACEN